MTTLTLYNGDCLQMMKDISANSIDLIICDLPYGCLANNRKGKRVGELKDPNNPNSNIVIENKPCAWDIKIDLTAFWKEIKRIRRNDHTPCLHFCTTKFGYDLIKSNESEFRYDLVWTKTNAVGFLSANKKPMSAHEMIYVFSAKGAFYERIDMKGDFPRGGGGTRSNAQFIVADCPSHTTEAGRRCVKSYFEVPNKKAKGGHPTAKPIELYKFLIERYCPAGGTVLDPTFGSCNSGRAAEDLGRTYIGIEQDEGFYDKAIKDMGF